MLELGLMVLPLPLWFLEQLWPFPAVIEETAKAVFIHRARDGRQALVWGLIFGIAEAFLFLVNANLLLTFTVWWRRLLLTVPMHGLTAGTYWTLRQPWWLGLAAAILIHAGFNQLVRR
jgi:hypothetical protein